MLLKNSREPFYCLLAAVNFLFVSCAHKQNAGQSRLNASKDYDIAAYVWPAYHHEPRMKEFYRGDDGEWERIYNAKPKWEGHDQPRQPLWGYVHEDDPVVMEMKIEAAHKYGVDIFIYDWYWFEDRPYLEEALDEGFLKANNNHLMKFYLMWANHDAMSTWDIERSHEREVIWSGSVDRSIFEKVVKRIIDKYFSHPSYYKIEGKPVLSIYHLPNLVKGLGGIEETHDAIEFLRSEVKSAGFPGLHLQVTARNSLLQDDTVIDEAGKVNLAEVISTIQANSITTYNWIHHVQAGRDYVQWGAQAFEHMEEIDNKMDMPYYVHVSVGWDNNPRFVEPKAIIENANPHSFEAFLLKAKDYVDQRPEQNPLITINSWNEWVEGSYLEPDLRWGYKYLETIGKVFPNKSQKP